MPIKETALLVLEPGASTDARWTHDEANADIEVPSQERLRYSVQSLMLIRVKFDLFNKARQGKARQGNLCVGKKGAKRRNCGHERPVATKFRCLKTRTSAPLHPPKMLLITNQINESMPWLWPLFDCPPLPWPCALRLPVAVLLALC